MNLFPRGFSRTSIFLTKLFHSNGLRTHATFAFTFLKFYFTSLLFTRCHLSCHGFSPLALLVRAVCAARNTPQSSEISKSSKFFSIIDTTNVLTLITRCVSPLSLSLCVCVSTLSHGCLSCALSLFLSVLFSLIHLYDCVLWEKCLSGDQGYEKTKRSVSGGKLKVFFICRPACACARMHARTHAYTRAYDVRTHTRARTVTYTRTTQKFVQPTKIYDF